MTLGFSLCLERPCPFGNLTWHRLSSLCAFTMECVPSLFYKRNLPHWQPDGTVLFVTWRLHGSLPKNVLAARDKSKKFSGAEFRRWDRILDAASSGPVWLKNPAIARCVAESIFWGAVEKRYELHAWVVMANHVHILIRPIVPMPEIMQGIKGFTARRANKLLRRSGVFWQDESFDHFVRDESEFATIRAYIERNPVSAGLISRPEQWLWSSASQSLISAQAGKPVPLEPSSH